MKVAQSCPTLWTHRPYSLWNSPGQNTGAGSLFLPQGIFPTQGSNPGLRHVRQILYQVNHKGSPQLKINKFNYKRKFLCRIHTWNIVNVQHLLLLNWVQKMRHNWIQWVAKTSQAMADVEPEPRSYFSQARACFFFTVRTEAVRQGKHYPGSLCLVSQSSVLCQSQLGRTQPPGSLWNGFIMQKDVWEILSAPKGKKKENVKEV